MPHTIAENLTRLSNAKDAIAAAIVDKGGTIEAGDGFESFADKIEAISGGGGVLISKNITENGTYYAVDDEADGYASVEVDVSSDIEALEYIKSIGNSVVVTDIIPQNDWALAANIKIGNAVSSTCDMLISAYSYTSGNLSGIYNAQFGTNNILTFYIGQPWSASGEYAIQGADSEYGKAQPFVMRRGAGKSIFGTKSVQITTTETLQSPTISLAICGKHHNSGGETIVPFDIREVTIYSVKLYDGSGNLIHELVPSQNKTTNRAGLYDLITAVFYPSSSSFDDFVKGPKIKGIPKVDATLTTKTITENGAYNATDDNADGYSSVTVNTPPPNNIDIFHTENMLWGVELNQQGGTTQSSGETYVSDYLDVSGYTKLHILRPAYSAMCFYNANKGFISYTANVSTGFVDIPNGAKYMRFNSKGNSLHDLTPVKQDAAVIVFNE